MTPIVHAEVEVRDVDETGDRAERRRVPVLGARAALGRCRGRRGLSLGSLSGYGDQPAGLEVDALVAVDIAVRIDRKDLAGASVMT